MENRIYVSIPLDALIVSGITSDCAVQIVAFRTKREKFSHKIEKVRFCKNV